MNLNLSVLFNETAKEAIDSLREEDLPKAFNKILEIRQKLFNGEPFFEIAYEMMNVGLMPRTNGGLPAAYCDISYLYDQMSKAEVRLTQVKNYVSEQKRNLGMSEMERVLEAAAHGGSMPRLEAPKWAFKTE